MYNIRGGKSTMYENMIYRLPQESRITIFGTGTWSVSTGYIKKNIPAAKLRPKGLK